MFKVDAIYRTFASRKAIFAVVAAGIIICGIVSLQRVYINLTPAPKLSDFHKMPTFDPSISKAVLIEKYRETFTNYVMEACFLEAQNILVYLYWDASHPVTNGISGEQSFIDVGDDVLEKTFREKGVAKCKSVAKFILYRLDYLAEFSERAKLGKYPQEFIDAGFDTNELHQSFTVLRTRDFRDIPPLSDVPIDEGEAREFSIERLSMAQDWDAPYIFWFYKLLLYYYEEEPHHYHWKEDEW